MKQIKILALAKAILEQQSEAQISPGTLKEIKKMVGRTCTNAWCDEQIEVDDVEDTCLKCEKLRHDADMEGIEVEQESDYPKE